MRYFIVYYFIETIEDFDKRVRYYGNVGLPQSKYPNEVETVREIIKKHEEDIGVEDCEITSIQELSKIDFDEFYTTV